MEQLEYNLSLTPDQRIRQYMDWLAFVDVIRAGGQEFYGVEPRTSATAD